jgi:hypothetical protein
MTRDPDPLGVRGNDPLTKWQREAAEQEEVAERTRRVEEAERRRREERQAQDTVEAVRTELMNEVAGLRDELKISRECITDATSEVIERIANKIFDEVDRQIKDTETKLYSLVESKFSRLEGRLDGALDAARTGRRFTGFANETVDEADIPNWRKPDKSTTH